MRRMVEGHSRHKPKRAGRTTLATLLTAALLTACAPQAPTTQDAPSATTTPRPLGGGAGGGPVTTETPATTAPQRTTPALAVEAEGLRLFDPRTGAARPIPFGTSRAQTLAALAFRGPPGTGTNGECGAGPLQYANWPDSLGLYFQDGAFAGWTLDASSEGAITTAADIAPGSTRAALEAAYAATITQTTLGTEFAAGDLYGLLDGAGQGAKVTNMWAGVSCNFR